MSVQRVVFTCLPNDSGRRRHRPSLSVHVAPRLDRGGRVPLSMFRDFENWPATLLKNIEAGRGFDVLVNNQSVRAELDSTLLDPDLWKALFGRAEVGQFVFKDLSARDLRSFSVTRLEEYIKNLYADVARQAGTSFPPVVGGPLAGLRDEVGRFHRADLEREQGRRAERESAQSSDNRRGPVDLDAWRKLDPKVVNSVDPFAEREQAWEARRAAVLKGSDSRTIALDLYETTRFYNRPEAREPYRARPGDPGPPPAPPPKLPDPDFHAYLGFLADHPALLRRLGLVLDFIVDLPDPASGEIEVRPTLDLADGNGIVAQPATAFTRNGDHFQPLAQDVTLQRDRFLRLDVSDHYRVLDLDVDGSALKLADFSYSLERTLLQTAPSPTINNEEVIHLPERDRPAVISVPALRSGGFAVVQAARASYTGARLKRSKELNGLIGGPKRVVLTAEDLVRGYRIEINQDRHSDWRSVCRRDVTYNIAGFGGVTVSGKDGPDGPGDQGYVKGASVTETPKKSASIYLHESVFGWDGWSLVVRRPGRAIPEPGGSLDDPMPVAPNNFPLIIDQTVPAGTLPRLRYGSQYSFRARTVDLAGNSTILEDSAIASPDARYLRYDPVVSPALVARHRFTEGESLHTLVIRSDLGVSAEEYPDLDYVQKALDGWDHTYRSTTERHVSPPKVAQAVAEVHGRFDPFMGPGLDHDRGLAIARREEGSFFSTSIADIETLGASIPIDGIELVDGSRRDTNAEKASRRAKLGLKLASWQADRDGFVPGEGEYVVHDKDQSVLPYLPDPLALGAAFYGLPGTSTPAGRTSTLIPFTGAWPSLDPFRVVLEEGALGIDTSTPGVLKVRLPASFTARVPLSSFVDEHGLDVMAIWALLGAADRTKMRADALKGRLWMLTPPEGLVFVHAVQRPLKPPSIEDTTSYAVNRGRGETFAWFAREMYVHSRSTGRVDMEAAWTEFVDDLVSPGPIEDPREGHAFDFPVDPEEGQGDGPLRVGAKEEPRRGIRNPDGTLRSTSEPSHRTVHEFRDTKRRRVRYTPVATSRFREYFPADITADPANITRRGKTVEIDVPSAARPAAPKIEYVVPVFRWDEPQQPAGSKPAFERRRLGGFRVYLDRPWWSSGEGELLGVVLRQPTRRRRPVERVREDVIQVRDALASAGLIRGEANMRAFRRGLRTFELSPFPPHIAEAFTRLRAAIDKPEFLDVIAEAFATPSLLGNHVTEWGQDPVWVSGALPASWPAPSHFTRPNLTVEQHLTLGELEDSALPGNTVAVVGHPVEFSPERGLWFCDIEMQHGRSYFPFVRLALARYQPHSLENCHLSKVIRADFAQLAAGRTLTLAARSDREVSVTLTGVGGIHARNASRWTARVDDASFPVTSRVVTASIERRIPGIVGDLAWEPIGDPVILSAPNDSSQEISWSGRLSVPEPLAKIGTGLDAAFRGMRSKGKYRIVVREYDRLDSELSEGAEFDRFLGSQIASRLVYADVVEL
jgi:hypothetical protein